MTEPTERWRGARRGLIIAGVALLVGVWLFLDARGVEVPSLARLWPGFLVLGGGVSLIDYLMLSRRPPSLGSAIVGIGLAVLLFPFTLGHRGWEDALDWLPGLPLVISLALLSTWAAEGSRVRGRLVSGIVFLGVAVAGFAARFDVLRRLLPSIQVFWAILLVAAGAVIAWTTLRKRE